MSFPWEKELRDYQVTAGKWLSQGTFDDRGLPFRGKLLADGLGLGKTRQALAAIRYRKEEGLLDAPAVVVTTATARIDWAAEARRFWPELTVCQPGGASAAYQKKTESDADFLNRTEGPWQEALKTADTSKLLLVNYENLPRVTEFWKENGLLGDSIVVDEAHNLKRSTSQPARLVRSIAGASRMTMLLTATPIDNRAHELFNLLDLCGPGRFGSFHKFVNTYFLVSNSTWGPGEVHDLLRPDELREAYKAIYLRRTAQDVFTNLPARLRHMHLVDAPAAVRMSPAKINVLKKGSKLDEILRESVRYKMRAAADFILNNISGPVVAYTYKQEDAEKLAKMLEERGFSVVLSHGDIPVKKRTALIEEWKLGKFDHIVSTMDALRESATLVRSKNMVFVDLDWRFVKVLQCEGRIDPARQPINERAPVAYHYFLTRNGPDEVVAEALMYKIRESQKLLKDKLAGSFGEFLGPLAEEEDSLAKLGDEDLLSAFVERATARHERLMDLGL